MPKLLKDNQLIDNPWKRAENDTPLEVLQQGGWLIPVEQFILHSEALDATQIGVILSTSTELSETIRGIGEVAAIAIDFPAFADGRGFSIARHLREDLAFKGDVLAIGNIIQDQLHYLKRCGFNGFEIQDDKAEEASLIQSLNDFSEAYQAALDNPTPLFRRRA